MMKTFYANYDPNTGVSTVSIKYKNKVFTGRSTLCDEDAEYESRITGCRFAHDKAIIKALKYDLAQAKLREKEAIQILHACTSCKNWDKSSNMAKILYHQVGLRTKEVKKLTKEVNTAIVLLRSNMNRTNAVHRDFSKPNKDKED